MATGHRLRMVGLRPLTGTREEIIQRQRPLYPESTLPMATQFLQIAMFSESYLPRISGVVHSVTTFVGALRRDGHRVIVVAPRYRGFADTDPDVIRFPSVRAPRQADFPLAIPYSPSGWRQLLQTDLDLVHTHSPFLMGAVGARLARTRHLPLVFTHHTLYEEFVHYAPITPRVTRPAVRRYVTAYANRCTCVIAPSHAIAARLRAQGVTTRIEVLPTGAIDADLIASLDPGWVRPVFHIPASQPLLVTASRLGKEKSVNLVLEAVANLVRHREATLLVVGGGPEEPALRHLARQLNLEDHIIFAGLQPHRKALECIAASDVFVFASQTETQGLAVVEAMACGLPVVAVNASGIPDAVADGETGFLVLPDAEAIAEKVTTLLDDPALRRSMSLRARELARQFSVEALTHRLLDLYRSLLPVRRH